MLHEYVYLAHPGDNEFCAITYLMIARTMGNMLELDALFSYHFDTKVTFGEEKEQC